MTDSTKASRATVQLGSIEVDGFQLPDGSYRMSQTQIAETIGLTERNARDFLRSKAIKSLLGKGYTDAISERETVEIESEAGKRGSSRIVTMPLQAVSAYWLWQAFRGNKQALVLCMALITESLERRFDSAFGVQRTENDYNQALVERLRYFETSLPLAIEAAAMPDIVMEENRRLRQQLLDAGIEPFSPPDIEDA